MTRASHRPPSPPAWGRRCGRTALTLGRLHVPVLRNDYLIEPPADADGILRGLTLPDMFAAAASAAPGATAITDQRRALTWDQWRAEVDAVTRGLQELGVAPGDVVAVQLPNH